VFCLFGCKVEVSGLPPAGSPDELWDGFWCFVDDWDSLFAFLGILWLDFSRFNNCLQTCLVAGDALSRTRVSCACSILFLHRVSRPQWIVMQLVKKAWIDYNVGVRVFAVQSSSTSTSCVLVTQSGCCDVAQRDNPVHQSLHVAS